MEPRNVLVQMIFLFKQEKISVPGVFGSVYDVLYV